MKKFRLLVISLVIAALVIVGNYGGIKDSIAQTNWGRMSVRSWFFSRAANTNEVKTVVGYLPAATSATEADVWGGRGEVNWPAAAIAINVISSSADDAAAGTGARTIYIEGLDANYDELAETVTLNGIGAVATVGLYLRVNLVTVVTAGAGGENAGEIAGIYGIAGLEIFRILTGRNATNRAIYTVPNECAIYMVNLTASASAQESHLETYTTTTTSVTYLIGGGVKTDGTLTTYSTEATITHTVTPGNIEIYFNRRAAAGVKTERGPIILANGSNYIFSFAPLVTKITENTDVWCHVIPNGITTVSCGFAFWEICNNASWQ